jgi:hypothetical protein
VGASPPEFTLVDSLDLGARTRRLFNLIWALVQANWAHKLCGDNKPMVLVAMYPAGMVAGILTTALFPRSAPLGVLFYARRSNCLLVWGIQYQGSDGTILHVD